jgi:hypothetical protein
MHQRAVLGIVNFRRHARGIGLEPDFFHRLPLLCLSLLWIGGLWRRARRKIERSIIFDNIRCYRARRLRASGLRNNSLSTTSLLQRVSNIAAQHDTVRKHVKERKKSRRKSLLFV